jgi:hypothetical protein
MQENPGKQGVSALLRVHRLHELLWITMGFLHDSLHELRPSVTTTDDVSAEPITRFARIE